jgi:hypothetical protein
MQIVQALMLGCCQQRADLNTLGICISQQMNCCSFLKFFKQIVTFAASAA